MSKAMKKVFSIIIVFSPLSTSAIFALCSESDQEQEEKNTITSAPRKSFRSGKNNPASKGIMMKTALSFVLQFLFIPYLSLHMEKS
jgi:hypothetical protein